MLRNLSTSLFEKERIKTTLMRAKELRPFAEKLVTLSKKETLHARRRALRQLRDRRVVAKLFDTLSARFSGRPGGYTRIIKLGPRIGDNAEMAFIELVGAEPAAGSTAATPADAEAKAKSTSGRRRKAEAAPAGEEAAPDKKRAPKRRAPAKAPREAKAGKASGRAAGAGVKKKASAGRKGASKQKG
jgi:large subunit ribosomal protein L17